MDKEEKKVIIECKNITVEYYQKRVLDGISFTIFKGEFVGIIGPNGAGKTTLFKIITGVKKAKSGEAFLKGRLLIEFSRKEIASIVAVVPQSTFIPPLFTVEDVIYTGRYCKRKSRFFESEEDKKVVIDAMSKTDTLKLKERFVSELSGGERQEVLIARALAQEPEILLLDEPISNLDIHHQIKLLNLIDILICENELTGVMVIHDLNLASRFCDRLILLNNGKIECIGRPEEVLKPEVIDKVYRVKTRVEINPYLNAPQVTVLGYFDIKKGD